jgi:two-component system nitrate/nitrite response regulator NarL
VSCRKCSGEFTPRQEDILREIQTGDGNKTIAHRLGITPGTLKVYMVRLMALIGVDNRVRLAFFAARRAEGMRYE